MARTADQIRLQGLGLVGPAFSGLNPYLAGIAGALSLAETGAESVLSATRLADSPGAWLDLIGQGAGVLRINGEDDDTYRARIGALPLSPIPEAIRRSVDAVLAGAGFGTCLVLDRQNASYFLADNDTAATEGMMELALDGHNILIGNREVYVICPEVNDDAVELAVCQAAARGRAAGITVRVIFLDAFAPATGLPWDAA